MTLKIYKTYSRDDKEFENVLDLLEKKYFIKYDKHFNKLANTIWYNKLNQHLLN